MTIKVSDNVELVKKIRAKIKENGGYCPCTTVRNEDTKCMCKEFLLEQECGPCHCGLYIKVEE